MDINNKKLLMIPGPIEFSPEVLASNSYPGTSHIASDFIQVFSTVLTQLRTLLKTEGGQPVVLSGSGSLGWDVVASNLVEKEEKVLVLSTGVFGQRFVDCLQTYGAQVDVLTSEIGDQVPLDSIQQKLSKTKYKLVTVTHVDTSTGVRSDIQAIAHLIQLISPETLLVVDGVCSVGGEDIQFDNWGIDVVMTASQKALGCPPGLAILMFSKKALNVFEQRKTPISSFYGSLKNWLPIMKAYQSLQPSYFATPSVQLILALHTSLTQILANPLDQIFETHQSTSKWFKSELEKLGLKLVTKSVDVQANTMSAIYYPEYVEPQSFLKTIQDKGVILAGGLHPEIKTKYFRVGHMGYSIHNPHLNHLQLTLKVIQEAVTQSKL